MSGVKVEGHDEKGAKGGMAIRSHMSGKANTHQGVPAHFTGMHLLDLLFRQHVVRVATRTGRGGRKRGRDEGLRTGGFQNTERFHKRRHSCRPKHSRIYQSVTLGCAKDGSGMGREDSGM